MNNKAGMAALIAALATLSTGCGVGEAKVTQLAENDLTAPLPVQTALPERADIYAMYQTTSTLESDSDAPVLARVAGEVIEVLVEEGDRVEQGQILARLDGERLRLEMLQAKANLEKVTSEYQRLVGLQERGLVSAAMYEGLEFDIESLQAGYELQRLNYNYTAIRAPIAGIVSSRDVKTGKQVRVNDPVFRITDTTVLVAHLKIPQTELVKFSAGHGLILSVDAMPEVMFAAEIARISPTIDTRNGTFRATAYIDNGENELAPGMFARFDIAYEKHENALIIPTAALMREDNITIVYVVSDGAATRRTVKTGIESDGVVEVLSGLDASETVVVTGQVALRDGSPVLASNNNIDLVSG